MKSFEDVIRKTNSRLHLCSIKQKGNRLYIRATVPNKEGAGKKAQDLRTGAVATLQGLQIAEGKAKKLESDLMLDRFNWQDWTRPTELKREQELVGTEESIENWLKKFEQEYWHKNSKSDRRLTTYKCRYNYVFDKLPMSEPLTLDTIQEFLLTNTEPDTAKRCNYIHALSALLSFAKVPNQISRYKGNYKPPLRTIPSDTEIEQVVDNIENKRWQYVVAILATFGLRPHEIFYLDTSRLSEKVPVLQIEDATKTGCRTVLPVLREWVDRWELTDYRFPNFQDKNVGNKDLGHRVTHGLKIRVQLPWTAYHLRDAYAIRCSVLGIESGITARMMGHSLQVHHNSYKRHIGEQSLIDAWSRATDS